MTRAEVLHLLLPLADDAILGLTLYGEARGEPIEGIIAAGCCVRNRVHDTRARWGTSYRAVCLQPAQFSAWWEAGSNQQTLLDAAHLLIAGDPPPALLEQCAWVALGVSRGALVDIVKGANHYHVATLNPRPSWAAGHTPVVQKGHHVFYRL